jgi:hypothetical protein
MRTATIKISIEIEVDVKGKYHPASNGSYEQPPESSEFEINEVWWQGMDITDMLDKEGYDFTQMEEQCIEQVEDER